MQSICIPLSMLAVAEVAALFPRNVGQAVARDGMTHISSSKLTKSLQHARADEVLEGFKVGIGVRSEGQVTAEDVARRIWPSVFSGFSEQHFSPVTEKLRTCWPSWWPRCFQNASNTAEPVIKCGTFVPLLPRLMLCMT